MKQYDAIIIGFGKGGKLLAAELASRNWKVAIIERSPHMYGGTCVNTGCIPTKALIHESEQAERLYRDDYSNQAKYYALAIGRKNKLVSFLRDKNYEHIKAHSNITLYDGTASFVSGDTVKVVSHDKKEVLLKGKEVFINTGSTPILPEVEGLKGSKVTLLESGNRFMPKSDRDIAESMLESLKRKGIEIRLNAYALSVYDTVNGVTLTYTDNSDNTPYFLEGDALLLATGRRPMTDDLNLHAAGIQTDAQGAVIVNGHLQTTSPHIWAIGDVKGGALYDYLSIDDFRIITSQLFGNKKRKVNDRLPVPYVIFTDPPLAHIGMTEEEAVKQGYSLQVSRLPAAAIPRARTLQQIDGMMKAIVNAHTGRIIGCTLFCIDAPEVINLVSLTMKNDLHYSVLRDFIFTHPSMSEGLNDLFKAF